MERRYQAVWEDIKKKSLLEKVAIVKIKAKAVATVLQGIMKEKSRECAPRRNLDLPTWGELEIVSRTPLADGRIEFHLRVPKELQKVSRVRASDL